MRVEIRGMNQKEFDERLKSVDVRTFFWGLLSLTIVDFYEKQRSLIDVIAGKQKGDKK